MINEFQKIEKTLKATIECIEIIKRITALLRQLWKYISVLLFAIPSFVLIVQINVVKSFLLTLSTDEKYNNFINFIDHNAYIILLIVLFALIITYLIKLYQFEKSKTSYYADNGTFIDTLHKKVIHDIRDNIKELDEDEKQITTGSPDAIKLTKKNMYQSLSNNMQNYIDIVAESLTDYCNETVSVCVKIVQIDNNTFDDPLAVTLARSSNTRIKRLKNDETLHINKNDDFKHLYIGTNTFYGKSNLLNELHDGNYHVEDSVETWSKKYVSTLIVPIRYYSKQSKHNNVNMDLDIMGFLCIDANKNMAQWEDIDSYELKVLNLFADAMYIYLKQFKRIYCIEGKE